MSQPPHRSSPDRPRRPSAGGSRGAAYGPRPARRGRGTPRGAVVGVAAVVLLGGLAIVGVRVASGLSSATSWSSPPAVLDSDTTTSPSPSPSAPASPSPSVSPPEVIPASFPKSGPGTWRYAPDQGPVLGTAGNIQHFRVAIETNVAVDVAGFAAKIDQTLGDPRSWIAGGTFRLQRVPATAKYDFTIYLATEATSTRMCAAGGTDTDAYTSCRTVGKVIINLDRWYLSVPDYVNAGIPLDMYRTYVVNHESGHQFGHGHELCPGKGKPAPVMEQQTLGLHGCVANPYPYLDGRRYAGPSGHY
jgi:Protein of unknown function (DUF3152)